ncbi:riboflavin biosynthesis protein RibD [Gottschalkia acidurici 9a]|uniref:Riboflavin biosynthesis protein RibD n=1 Tax=Gottschalkia acidurici (strain ATCC 7906 / DSM 604 / BCRC 14475 / CIP 104303 / KCTC 5404 / NCIMB 10678 / 9a) TaxID=1128398 RepID=K0B3V7_GOTA9|nr:bifunctional diaminohydroxyphosphoribosylaminopyrimidine deaminase/5-amino-6-(5-phosphoribosylamino)uracil reductase RibD [Gottschalkia acidurici]AFS79590.1 riboflavin biosynthesis protein RibD [Gottschalkia acidurici 9a]
MESVYMKRAIELAKKGEGHVSPNPLVGAVIVKNESIIGEGYHGFYGGDHAEINALKNSTESVEGSTMYVTLEPCSHFGKTPPCVNAIVENNIKKVVIGLKDPNLLVSGRGIQILKSNGIEVVTSVLEDECKKLNEIFLKYITTKTPFVILKYAMTLDGKIATHIGDSKWISNSLSRKHVHEIRHKLSSIMVGIGTVLKDNPSLNTRLEDKEGLDPIRIIVDTKGRIPLDSKVINLKSSSRTIVATTELAPKDKLKALEDKDVEIIITPVKDSYVDLIYLLKSLGSKGIDSILLEGGSELSFSALQENIVDKVVAFISPKIIGGSSAKTPIGGTGIEFMKDAINLNNISLKTFNEDIMIEGYIEKE